ncbi:tetratricopeptide repeat protein [Nonlabens antarcticus]|uniref:tetratricopeptide repeat protein n=1 Tax=Nonlabens antarcticus TaxID=392714 RepID=UPI0018916BCC|nr:tetratricopeptide repeat protein [Nonlabens antarcticus]
MSKSELLHLENDWKETTMMGNDLVDCLSRQALKEYSSAFAKAKKLMVNIKSCINFNIPIMHIYLISCNNLTEVYTKLGQWDMAETICRRSVFYTIFLRKDKSHYFLEEDLNASLTRQLLMYKELTIKISQPSRYNQIIEEIKLDPSHAYFN